jgi:hypothetical protein
VLSTPRLDLRAQLQDLAAELDRRAAPAAPRGALTGGHRAPDGARQRADPMELTDPA